MKVFNVCTIGLLFIAGCSKDDGKDVVDCFGESLMMNVHHNVSTENPKTVNFNVTYSGSHTLKGAIKWNFGDGTIVTVNGTSTSHTYTQAGSYNAVASVSLVSPDCTVDVKESVVVQ